MKINRHKIVDANGIHKFSILTNNDKYFTPTLHIDGGICVAISRKDASDAIQQARKIGHTIKSNFEFSK